MNQLIRRRIWPLMIALLAGGVLGFSVGDVTMPAAFAADAPASPASALTPAMPVLPAPLTVPVSGAGSSAAPAAAAAPLLLGPVTAPNPLSGGGTSPALPAPMTAATPASAGSTMPGNGSAPAASSTLTPQRVSKRHKYSPAPETFNESLSNDLTAYLHATQPRYQKRYCEVNAYVYSKSSGSVTRIELTGEVKSDLGKEHAANEARDWVREHGGAENLEINNKVKTSSSLICPSESSAAQGPATGLSSAPAQSAIATAPSASNDPCLCLKDERYCKQTCQTNAAASAPTSPGGSIAGLFRNFIQPVGTQLKQCTDTCEQTKDHCLAQCGESGGSAPPPSEGSPPPDAGGPPPD